MYSFDLISAAPDVRIIARGSTRAGLVTAALKGTFATARPNIVPESDHRDRSFHLTSEDAPELLVDVLNEALSLSAEHGESYDDVRFDLITDKEARGAFVGQPVTGFGAQLRAAKHHGVKVEKNDEGMWETTVTFDA